MIKKSIIRVCFFAVAMICTLFISCTDFNYTERRYNERKDGIESRYSDYTIASQDYSESESELSCFLARYPLTDGIPDYSQDSKLLEYKSDCAYYSLQLENWQSSYDYQVAKLRSEGSAKLSQLREEWVDAEVLAADRGASGSMSLVALQQKQKAVDYAGSDLSLAGDDGLYGLTMNELRTTLATNKSQAESSKSIAAQKYDESLTRQNQDYADLLTTKNNQVTALGQEKDNLAKAEQNVTDASSWIDKHQSRYDDLVKKHDA